MNTEEDEFRRIEEEAKRQAVAEDDDTQTFTSESADAYAYRCGYEAGVVAERKAQRQWVGLTDEDLDYLCHLAYTGDEEFALTVQAKLKEKNT